MSNVTKCHRPKLIFCWHSLDNLVSRHSRAYKLCGEIVKEFFSQFPKRGRSWTKWPIWRVKWQPLSSSIQAIKRKTTIPRYFGTHIEMIQKYIWISKKAKIVVFWALCCLDRTYQCHVFVFLEKDRGCRAFRHFVTISTPKS